VKPEVVIDQGIPGGDMSVEVTYERSVDGSIHIIDIKQYEPLMKPKNGYNMPDGVFPDDIPGFDDTEDNDDEIIRYCEEYTPDIDGLCIICGEPLTKHED